MSPSPSPDSATDRDTESGGDSFLLFRRARTGDERALRSLVARYEERLWRIVRIRTRAMRSRSFEAEEIIQAARSIDLSGLEGEDPVGLPELLQLLSEQVQKALEGQAAGPEPRLPRRAPPVPRQYPHGRRPLPRPAALDRGLEVERRWAANLRVLLDDQVRELPPQFKEVILMRDYCCAPWSEIAAKVGVERLEDLIELHTLAWQVLKKRIRDQIGDAL